MSDVAIHAKAVRKSFDGKEFVLNGVELEIPKGKVTVLIGFSGTGKSVLLRHFLGLEKPTEGSVEIFGENISIADDVSLTRIRQQFGVLFQNAALFDDMTTVENVCFPIFEHRPKMKKNEVIAIAEARLKSVGLSEKDFNKLPNQLSGGMRKRTGLARALALDPEIILYDEPTTGLDPIVTEMVDNLILDTHKRREGLTSVIVTHDLEAGFRIGDFVAMLDKGHILLAGTRDDFMKSDIELVRRFVAKVRHA